MPPLRIRRYRERSTSRDVADRADRGAVLDLDDGLTLDAQRAVRGRRSRSAGLPGRAAGLREFRSSCGSVSTLISQTTFDFDRAGMRDHIFDRLATMIEAAAWPVSLVTDTRQGAFW
jgi:hypothetical protein